MLITTSNGPNWLSGLSLRAIRCLEGGDDDTKKKDDEPVTMTQGELNKLIADRLKRQEEGHKKAIDVLQTQLDGIKGKSKRDDEERTRLSSLIDDLKNQNLTTEQRLSKEAEKAKRDGEERLNGLTAERDFWKTLYERDSIDHALTSAAMQGKVYKPENGVIQKLLRNDTELVEVIDSESQKPTGRYEVKVKVVAQKDGQDVELRVTPQEAVKLLSEKPEYANLFEENLKGGSGFDPAKRQPPKLDPKNVTMETWAEMRKQLLK